jgi:NADH:ubiquinone oxidoreductase subunit F (NADH-binding)
VAGVTPAPMRDPLRGSAAAAAPVTRIQGLPRLLAGLSQEPMSWTEHRRQHGELPDSSRSRSGLPDPLLGELRQSGLRGRGGGGFPLDRKLQAIAEAGGTPIVLVNANEGEPMSVKDRMLLASVPHLVLDGALALAAALHTSDVVIAIDEGFADAIDALQHALSERTDIDAAGRPSPQLVAVPTGYVSGQETSVVQFINRGVLRPLTQPPRVTERGIAKRPTLVSNVETLAHVALIARHGADWFREIGPDDEPGSALVTFSGGVVHPGVYEIEHGSHLGGLIEAAGGFTETPRAFLFGGYAGTWVDGRNAMTLRLSRNGLHRAGATIGAGIIVALPQSACPVAEVAAVADWMEEQSAHQCGPCTNGLGSIADTLADVRDGHAQRTAPDDLRRWSSLVLGRGACAHPDGVARFVTTALSVFNQEFAEHARRGPCQACAGPPVLSTPQRSAA